MTASESQGWHLGCNQSCERWGASYRYSNGHLPYCRRNQGISLVLWRYARLRRDIKGLALVAGRTGQCGSRS